MEAKIVKEWNTKAGLPAAILIVTPTYPHYVGYVGVEQTSKLFGRKYNTMDEVSVHGGLTYSEETDIGDEYPTAAVQKMWWFGFDLAHAGDAIDWEAGKQLIETKEEEREVKAVKRIIDRFPEVRKDDKLRSLDYVKRQCENLAIQLKAMEHAKD